MATTIETANRLYLFTRYSEPAFFVCIDPLLRLVLPEMIVGLPVYYLSESGGSEPWDFDFLHGWLHKRLGTVCPQKYNTVSRRSGEDSGFSRTVRCGHGDNDNPQGCAGTPIMDIDGLDIADGKIECVIEAKHKGEAFGEWQRDVLDNLERLGLKWRQI